VGNDGKMRPQTERDIVLFARTNFRNERRIFGIRQADRRAHMYVIGKTGTGKSTLLETLIRQDIARGEGVALLDPHGDLAEKVLAGIPEGRKCDLLYLDPIASQRDFYLFLDEFQNFTTLSLASMLSELRKYRVNMVLAHQYLAQLDLPIRNAILGNVGTIISFPVGMEDAEILAREFYPGFAPVDLVSLPNHCIYLRLMVDGVVSSPFSAETVLA
jgi:type IV secretory pathway VirB4 component